MDHTKSHGSSTEEMKHQQTVDKQKRKREHQDEGAPKSKKKAKITAENVASLFTEFQCNGSELTGAKSNALDYGFLKKGTTQHQFLKLKEKMEEEKARKKRDKQRDRQRKYRAMVKERKARIEAEREKALLEPKMEIEQSNEEKGGEMEIAQLNNANAVQEAPKISEILESGDASLIENDTDAPSTEESRVPSREYSDSSVTESENNSPRSTVDKLNVPQFIPIIPPATKPLPASPELHSILGDEALPYQPPSPQQQSPQKQLQQQYSEHHQLLHRHQHLKSQQLHQLRAIHDHIHQNDQHPYCYPLEDSFLERKQLSLESIGKHSDIPILFANVHPQSHPPQQLPQATRIALEFHPRESYYVDPRPQSPLPSQSLQPQLQYHQHQTHCSLRFPSLETYSIVNPHAPPQNSLPSLKQNRLLDSRGQGENYHLPTKPTMLSSCSASLPPNFYQGSQPQQLLPSLKQLLSPRLLYNRK